MCAAPRVGRDGRKGFPSTALRAVPIVRLPMPRMGKDRPGDDPT